MSFNPFIEFLSLKTFRKSETMLAKLALVIVIVVTRGVKQVQSSIAQLEDNLYEMSKPLTRTEDDTDRDALLKQQVYMFTYSLLY